MGRFILAGILFGMPLEVATAHRQDCLRTCYETKRACDDMRAFAAGKNSCFEELTICRQSCITGAHMNTIDPQPVVITTFRPIIKDLL